MSDLGRKAYIANSKIEAASEIESATSVLLHYCKMARAEVGEVMLGVLRDALLKSVSEAKQPVTTWEQKYDPTA